MNKKRKTEIAFIVGITLNILFALTEYIVGYSINSLALLSDASHNLSDVVGLVIAYVGMLLTYKEETDKFTYGYKKASILASLFNCIILIVIVFNITLNAISRLHNPPKVEGISIVCTAGVGVIINSISAYLFYKSSRDDINIKAAFVNLFMDAIVSIGVVISAYVMIKTKISIIDPIISLVIAFVVVITLIQLLSESVSLALDGIPKNIDIKKVKKLLSDDKRIIDSHHMHIWAISSNLIGLTVHITVLPTLSAEDVMDVKQNLKLKLKEVGIKHATIEVDMRVSNFKEI